MFFDNSYAVYVSSKLCRSSTIRHDPLVVFSLSIWSSLAISIYLSIWSSLVISLSPRTPLDHSSW